MVNERADKGTNDKCQSNEDQKVVDESGLKLKDIIMIFTKKQKSLNMHFAYFL